MLNISIEYDVLIEGAATAARTFNEALAKIAMHAQNNGTNDIGMMPINPYPMRVLGSKLGYYFSMNFRYRSVKCCQCLQGNPGTANEHCKYAIILGDIHS